MVTVIEAESPEHFSAVRALMRAFIEWHYERHHEYRDLINRYFQPDKFESELAALPGEFAPPRGRLLVAMRDGEAAGCVALRDLGDGICEMKRMFVPPTFHGQQIGRRLAERVIEEARKIGYRRMRLDTGPKQQEAQGLYRSLGFRPIDAYYELGDEMKDWLVFMECDLGA